MGCHNGIVVYPAVAELPVKFLESHRRGGASIWLVLRDGCTSYGLRGQVGALDQKNQKCMA
jgi:hypothetical protein